MEINFINQSSEDSWRAYGNHCEPLFNRTLEVLEKDDNVLVNIVLMDDVDIHQYNKDFRGIDRATDVLSFEDGEVVDGVLNLGDILISVQHIESQAKEYGHSLKREFCFLMVHGFLHLYGYDHQTPEEEAVMLKLQKEILEGYADKNSESNNR